VLRLKPAGAETVLERARAPSQHGKLASTCQNVVAGWWQNRGVRALGLDKYGPEVVEAAGIELSALPLTGLVGVWYFVLQVLLIRVPRVRAGSVFRPLLGAVGGK
jgi:hypothetical protein